MHWLWGPKKNWRFQRRCEPGSRKSSILPPLYQTNDRFKDRTPTDLRLCCTNDLDCRDELELPSLVYTSPKTAYGHCTTEAVPHIGLHYLSYDRQLAPAAKNV